MVGIAAARGMGLRAGAAEAAHAELGGDFAVDDDDVDVKGFLGKDGGPVELCGDEVGDSALLVAALEGDGGEELIGNEGTFREGFRPR
jgi:hypothetical protein